MDIFLQILDKGVMTLREGFCTGTAKSVSRYNIF